MSRIAIRLLVALWLWTVGPVTAANQSSNLTTAVQYSVNWYRFWHGTSSAPSSLKTSSSGWAVLIDGQAYVALPDMGLAVELATDATTVRPLRVEELPDNIGGRAAVNAYIERLRTEAAYQSAGKADRFNVPRREAGPVLEAVKRGEFQVVTLGVLSIPKQDLSPASKEQQSKFAASVRSALEADSGLVVCAPKRALIPQYGSDDPEVFVLVENGILECGDFVLVFRQDGRQWRYDKWNNRFGDLDSLIERVRNRTISILTL